MRGKGGLTLLQLRESRSSTPASSVPVLRQHRLHDVGDELLRELHVAVEVQKATSGSTIQNSVRWRRVLDFSARKVGPKQ